MSLFHKTTNAYVSQNNVVKPSYSLSDLVLQTINTGVIITDANGMICSVNPAGVRFLECGMEQNIVNFDIFSVLKLEELNGNVYTDETSPVYRAFSTLQSFSDFQCKMFVAQTNKHIPISLSVFIVDYNRIIIFRDISKELEEDNAQAEFISTASHEMRTPVASIEGYLSLALNPQTATIDDRARKYLDSAHQASQHLGKLFQDLLDTTKLDDGRLRPEMKPVELRETVRQLFDRFVPQFAEKNINPVFGSDEMAQVGSTVTLQQSIYTSVDLTFLEEILNNLFDNVKKYSPNGGSMFVNVVGDSENGVISIKDSGIGISNSDLPHIFQKFYRADNSDTRVIGGTGLGLYLVKQRVEAMGGKVWAESILGSGTTFYVSFPRLSSDEYMRRVAIINNQQQFTNGGIK